MHIKNVLAVDPGTSKCGFALVYIDEDKINITQRHICETNKVKNYLQQLKETIKLELILLGKGTYSKQTNQTIQEVLSGVPILLMDEKDTTFEARSRYWEHYKRKGWRKFIPASMQVPPEPIDDFVAFILVERFIKSNRY